jgi:hypothetical protein
MWPSEIDQLPGGGMARYSPWRAQIRIDDRGTGLTSRNGLAAAMAGPVWAQARDVVAGAGAMRVSRRQMCPVTR